jgi:hypothetical protein
MIEADDLASDLADNAINPATAQPIISLFIHPPISTRPLWSELAKLVYNWLRDGIAYFRQFGIHCQVKSSPCEKLPMKSSLYGLTKTWLAAYFQATQSKYVKGQNGPFPNLNRLCHG